MIETPLTPPTAPTASESSAATNAAAAKTETKATKAAGNLKPTIQEFGVVEAVHHPLVILRGFPSVLPGEVIMFEDNVRGQVMGFDQDKVEVMVFSSQPPKVGSSASRTNQVLSFPVSMDLLGKMMSPLGEQILGRAEKVKKAEDRLLESPPPPLSHRRRITQRLHTGVSLADVLLPIGRGQRELVVGDRKTGKTAFVTSAAKSQSDDNSMIVYASIGKKSVELRQLFDTFTELKMINKTVMIASSATDPVSSIVLTPYAAIAMAEYLRDQGNNVLVIFDDLSQHAKFYRELSLLAKHFPGRDSYPGNIFSVHAQLLERAGCFQNPLRPDEAVAITCLPMAETTDSDLTEYIVSNLISITDGHLLFDNTLFQQGQRPAIHTALSVTRVGKQTQKPLERDISRTVLSFVTKYEKIKELTHFGSELSESSQSVIHQGTVLMNFFAQAQRVTLPVKLQQIMLAIIWLQWIKKDDKASIRQVVENLLSAYASSREIQDRFDKMLDVKKFDELLEKVTAERAFIATVSKI